MKLSDYVIDNLAEQGITHIFEVCGGALSHLLNSIYGRTDITTVSMHHEMAASIAAEGYARASENFGVAMATSGPGATNLITGIGSCYFDSIPCLFITGQVNTYEYKHDLPVRQIGFQETDIVSIVKPIVKEALLLENEEHIVGLLENAYTTMKSGRKGPVLLDLPMNIQRAEIYPEKQIPRNKKPQVLLHYNPKPYEHKIKEQDIEEIYKTISESRRPIILSGGGVRSAKACDELHKFAHDTNIPVVTSLMGLDSYPHNDPLFVGMIGTYGNRYANLAIANSDLVIALGTRLDTRQTGTMPSTFARNALMIHVDIDANELNQKISAFIPVHADVKQFFEAIDTKKITMPEHKSWLNKVKSYKEAYPSYSKPIGDNIQPNYFLHYLSQKMSGNTIVCVDVGQIQMWAAQSMDLGKHNRFLTEGGMASIGSALPMAIGASFAKPDKIVIAIVGDGGFQLNIQELQTIFHHTLPIKIVMLNNDGYGMIKQFQEQYMGSRFQSSGIGYSNPNFQSVVSAYKIRSRKINSNDEISWYVNELLSDRLPRFLEVNIDPSARALPKLSVNRPIEDQEPTLPREELKRNMIVDMYEG